MIDGPTSDLGWFFRRNIGGFDGLMVVEFECWSERCGLVFSLAKLGF